MQTSVLETIPGCVISLPVFVTLPRARAAAAATTVAPMVYGASRLAHATAWGPSRVGRRRRCAAKAGCGPSHESWATRAPRYPVRCRFAPWCAFERGQSSRGMSLPILPRVSPVLVLAHRMAFKALPRDVAPRQGGGWPRVGVPRHVTHPCVRRVARSMKQGPRVAIHGPEMLGHATSAPVKLDPTVAGAFITPRHPP